MKDGQRERGTIASIQEDTEPGRETLWVQIKLGSGFFQGFGGYYLDADMRKQFLLDLSATFGGELINEECYALRYEGFFNDSIIGLESVRTGRIFTVRNWLLANAERWNFKLGVSPKQRRARSLRWKIEQAKRHIQEAEKRLARLDETFYDWDMSAAHRKNQTDLQKALDLFGDTD